MSTNDTIKAAMEKAQRAQRDVDTLMAYAPYAPGSPENFMPHGIYGAKVTAVYKVHTIAELRDLIAALPPVECRQYRGTFAGVKPTDWIKENDGTSQDADGVTLQIQAGATVGKYPCDRDAMSAQWYTDTPAGRLRVVADFYHSGRDNWPHIKIMYERERGRGRNTGREHETRRIARIDLMSSPPHSERMQFSSGDARTPGSFLIWFRDAETRELALQAME